MVIIESREPTISDNIKVICIDAFNGITVAIGLSIQKYWFTAVAVNPTTVGKYIPRMDA